MTALDGGPHGTTETTAAYTEAALFVAAGKAGGVAAYCLSILRAIAAGQQPMLGETAQDYAQRHLEVLAKLGYIEQTAEVPT